jgi:hypothetical protein
MISQVTMLAYMCDSSMVAPLKKLIPSPPILSETFEGAFLICD